MSHAEWSKYRDAEDGILEKLDEILEIRNLLTMILRLRQITGGLFTDKKTKLERVVEIIKDDILPYEGRKVIIYSNWLEMVQLYADALQNYHPAVITGMVEPEQRQREVDRFQSDSDCRIVIGTIGAVGTGLTLTKANTVIFVDKPWTSADNDQAEDRAHRIGTMGPVNIITVVAKYTIDERIERMLEKNRAIFDEVVDGRATKECAKKVLLQLLGVVDMDDEMVETA